jgi:thymidylate synthase
MIDQMALPPCHVMFQMDLNSKNELSCHVYMRSADVFLGVPFNIASYALLTKLIANQLSLKTRDLIISFGNIHLYENHYGQALEQLSRVEYEFPEIEIDKSATVDNFCREHVKLLNYNHHPFIPAAVAV